LEEAREAATRIVRDATRAAEIVSRIRQIFTKGTPQRKLTNLNSLARETIELLSSDISRHAIFVRTDFAPDLPHVMADPVQLQLMVNLIANGIDAMKDKPKKGELILTSWRTENGGVAMSFSDNGRGLPSENMERIFETFFTTKSHGSGMGLSISRSIIEAHEGALSAAPNYPHGAKFQFTLPSRATDTEA
jgi:signal transduction histidine kinase